MAEPIVFISLFRVRAGAAHTFAKSFTEGVALIANGKPRTALFAAYINDNESELRIVHAFPDAEAMSSHFEGSDERASSIAEIVQPAGYEVFGPAPALAVDQLEREATASGVELKVYRDWVGGFLRAPA